MSSQREQFFFGHGKLLLTSEYFILDGAQGLALPTTLGQTLTVRYKKSFEPKLIWKGYDSEGKLWFDASFELWHFEIATENPSEEIQILQKILQEARKLNPHFLREEVEVYVETKLDFPLEWGLGSSSTLIYNIAQWAYISPFELGMRTLGGSGYDIACAGSMGPIVYQKIASGPSWKQVNFHPHFHENLYFVYLGKKAKTAKAIEDYKALEIKNKQKTINELTHLTDEMIEVTDLSEFESLIHTHENIVSKAISLPRVQDTTFSDYWGAIKSLGAWGGDFCLVTSKRDQQTTMNYFKERGFKTIIPFDEIVCRDLRYISAHQVQAFNDNEIIQ